MNDIKCPVCFSQLKQTGKTYNCPFCGARFTSDTQGGKTFLIDASGARYQVDGAARPTNAPVYHQVEKKPKNTARTALIVSVFVFFGLCLCGIGFLTFRALSTPRRVPAAKPTYEETQLGSSGESAAETTEPEKYVTEDLSDDMGDILPLMFGKPLGQITVEDLDSVRYFSTSSSIITELRTVRYSFEDYFDYEDKNEFEKTVQTVEIPYDMMDSTFRSSDLQFLQMLTYVDCSNIRPGADDLSRHKQLKKLNIYGRSLEEIAGLIDADNLLELSVEGDEVADLTDLKLFPNLLKLELEDTAITDLSPLMESKLTALSLIDNENIGDYRQLASMTGLVELNLESELKDIDFIAQLPELKRLSLIDTKLLRLDPLIGCQSLTELYLEDNRELKDQNAVAQMTNLQALTIDDVETLEILRPLVNLKRLTIDGFYTAEDLSVLGVLANLEYLELHGLGNSVKSFAPLTGLTALREVNLSGGSFYFNTTDLFSIPNLERLNLSGSTFGSDFSKIGNLTQIKYLNLDKIHVTVNNSVQSSGYYTEVYYDSVELNDILPALSALTTLEELHLRENEIESVDFASTLTQLKYLDISENYVKDLSPLATCTALNAVLAVNTPILPETVPEGLTVAQ